MESIDNLKVDVDEIIKQKNPQLYRKLPKFFINMLKKIIHQEEINDFLRISSGKTGLDFIDATLKFMDVKYEFYNFKHIPENGRYVFASNHPLGGLESLVLMDIISQKFEKFVFVVNDILMALRPLNELFLPVNKHGAQSKTSISKLNSAFSSDYQILFFPAGLVSRRRWFKIRDLKWQKTFVAKAVEYKRDIVPVYIEGKNSNFFYTLANLRKFLGIKANIEMLFLPHEMFKQRGKTVRLIFGEPIPYTNFDSSKTYSEWADYLYKETYSLKKVLKNKK